MRQFSWICLFIICSGHVSGQRKRETLSLSNYTEKARAAAKTIGSEVSLSSAQTDSVAKIYQDYFLNIIHTRDEKSPVLEKSQAFKEFKNQRDLRLTKIMNAAKYKLLLEKRQIELQGRVKMMDSLYKRRN